MQEELNIGLMVIYSSLVEFTALVFKSLLGFDCKGCPVGGEVEHKGRQIPTLPPICPGREELGVHIDKSISGTDLYEEIQLERRH